MFFSSAPVKNLCVAISGIRRCVNEKYSHYRHLSSRASKVCASAPPTSSFDVVCAITSVLSTRTPSKEWFEIPKWWKMIRASLLLYTCCSSVRRKSCQRDATSSAPHTVARQSGAQWTGRSHAIVGICGNGHRQAKFQRARGLELRRPLGLTNASQPAFTIPLAACRL